MTGRDQLMLESVLLVGTGFLGLTKTCKIDLFLVEKSIS
jgi:hypothetical protein